MTKFLTYIFIVFFTFTSSVNAEYSDAINRGNTGAGIFSLKNFDNEKNKIMFTKNIFASNILGVDGAITLGNIQLYYNKNNPYKIVAPYSTTDYGFMPLEYHEDAHINQWHRDGALKFIWNWLQNGGASMHNSYEREASLEGMNRLKDEGVYHIIQNNKYKYYKNGEIE